jgi:hypothetical protein
MPSGDRARVLRWLLDGDPAVRWQVMRDLVDSLPSAVLAERERVAREGWGARLLARQDPDGRWAGGIYSPKWTSTTYTLLLLHWLGLPAGTPAALAGCRQIWDAASYFGGGLTVSRTVRLPEACVTGMFVLLAASFGYRDPRVDAAAEWLLEQQLPDGGWNCRSVRDGSTHGSFHTSITVLDALLVYRHRSGGVPVDAAMRQGREFFLTHHLYRSHRTGNVVNSAMKRFPFPPQWHFDVLRGLEHFRAAGPDRDDRLQDAIEVVRRARRPDGTWPVYAPYPGQTWFRMEPPGPSRWATLRALRVLEWWDAGS